MRPKLIYFLMSLFLFIITTVCFGLFISAPQPSQLYSFFTYTTVGFYVVIITFILIPVTFCATIHALINLFQKREKIYKSWQEREKKAALDAGIFFVKLRIFGLRAQEQRIFDNSTSAHSLVAKEKDGKLSVMSAELFTKISKAVE